MYVCLCKAVTDKQIRDAVDNGVQNIAQLQESCGAASGCGRCRDVAQELIDERLADARYYSA
ncbi:MAG: (2Fe-2S)-binding protein [Pseudomonadales bacterium]|jgi:bacterioferritin-associated ferredoxin